MLVMSYMCTNLNSSSRVTLLKILQPLNQELVKLASLIPAVFPNVSLMENFLGSMVAQLVECRTHDHEIVGLNPTVGMAF